MMNLRRMGMFLRSLEWCDIGRRADGQLALVTTRTMPKWVQSPRSKGWTLAPQAVLYHYIAIPGHVAQSMTERELSTEIFGSLAQLWRVVDEQVGEPTNVIINNARHPDGVLVLKRVNGRAVVETPI